MLGGGELGQVHQVGQRGCCRQQRRQRARAIGRQRAQLQVQFVHVIGRQHAGTAAVGDDAQALAHRAVARGQALGGREQLDEGAHAHRAGAAQYGIEHLVAADDGAGMRLRGHVAVVLAPGLEHHHGLGVGSGAQRTGEAPRIGDALHVDHDTLRVAIVGQVVEHRPQADLGMGAERDHAGKTNPVLARPVQDRGSQRTRLRHQRQLPRRRQLAGRAGVELQQRALEALAVRPQQPEAVTLRDAVHLLRLDLADAAGQHQRGLDPDASGQLQGRQDFVLGQRNDGQVGARLRQIAQRAGGVHVQRHHRALERLRRHVRQQRTCLRRLLLRRVLRTGEQDDRLRFEQRGEVMLVHGQELQASRKSAQHRFSPQTMTACRRRRCRRKAQWQHWRTASSPRRQPRRQAPGESGRRHQGAHANQARLRHALSPGCD